MSVTIEKVNTTGVPFKDARNLIKAQGKFKRIGTGAFGEVYGSKNSNLVYKIGEVYENEPYLAYIKTVITQKEHNPFTPKIYGVRIYQNKKEDEDSYFVVCMEKLKPIDRNDHRVYRWFSDQLETSSDSSRNAIAEQMLGIKTVVPPAVSNALKLLKKAWRKSKQGDWDLHSGNFMKRGKQIVITDPLA